MKELKLTQVILFSCVGVTRSSWRITVRQLESMIRLSEAMAKMACSDEVLPKHVQEAFRLLNKSIIRVETPDIDFEEDILPPEAEETAPAEQPSQNGEPLANAAGDDQQEKTAKPSVSVVRVTYEEYKTIANLLILYLRQLEDGGGRCSLFGNSVSHSGGLCGPR